MYKITPIPVWNSGWGLVFGNHLFGDERTMVEQLQSMTHLPVISVSVVVPVYSGAGYLERLIAEIDELREKWAAERAPMTLSEVILVDDSAIDTSPELIDKLAAGNPWIVALHLSRNFGQHGATVAGVLHTSGDWIVTLDEDLQHPPSRINELIERAVQVRSDVVYAHPGGGAHRTLMRDFTSRSFKRLLAWLSNNPKLRYVNSFRLMRGSVARAAASVCMHDTYLDVNLSWFTQRVEVVSMELTDERYITTGKSGYSMGSLLSHAWRMLFSSHLKILRLGTLLGFGMLVLTALGSVALIVLKFTAPETIPVTGWASLMLAISFFGGLSIFMIGISLQYLSTLVLRAHGKPTFFPIDRSQDARVVDHFVKKVR